MFPPTKVIYLHFHIISISLAICVYKSLWFVKGVVHFLCFVVVVYYMDPKSLPFFSKVDGIKSGIKHSLELLTRILCYIFVSNVIHRTSFSLSK